MRWCAANRGRKQHEKVEGRKWKVEKKKFFDCFPSTLHLLLSTLHFRIFMHSAIKQQKRKRRHARVRAKISGTASRPRLSVYKSNRFLQAQLIDDEGRHTLASVISPSDKGKTKTLAAREAGKMLALAARKLKIERVVFDRGGFLYTGRIIAFAQGAREGGLLF